MCRTVNRTAVLIVIGFAAAQLVRPARTNPPTEAGRTIHAQQGATSGLVAVLDRACGDCHSNRTQWPWYTRVAPTSWIYAYGVAEGRKAVNFSEWAAYAPERQRNLLVASCADVKKGKMPGSPYTLLNPNARLSASDVETICAAARQAGLQAARASR